MSKLKLAGAGELTWSVVADAAYGLSALAGLPDGSTAQLTRKFECGSANDITDSCEMIVIELANGPAGAKGGNHIPTGCENRSCNTTNTHSMLLIVHCITAPPGKRQAF